MGIHRACSIGVFEVKHIAIAERRNFDFGYVTIRRSEYGQTLSAFRFDVKSGMKMIASYFAHIASKEILLAGFDGK
jgi:hypothetical protein